MAWLTDFTQHCCSQLDSVSDELSSLKNDCLLSSDHYYQIGSTLVQEKQYSGQGASSFLASLGTDTNTYRQVLDGIGHVASGARVCSDTIRNSSSTYDGRLTGIVKPSGGTEAQYFNDLEFDAWKSYLIDQTLANVNKGAPAIGVQDPLSSILVSGSGAILDSFNAAKQSLHNIAGDYASNEIMSAESLSSDPVAYEHSEGYYFQYEGGEAPFRAYCYSVASDLSNQVWTNLSAWAEDIAGATLTFFLTLQNSETYLSARDIYDFIYSSEDGTQSTNKPITITPYTNAAGQPCLLITVGGTDNQHNWDDNIDTAINTGMNYPSKYLPDVERAIAQYMQEHPEMRGSQVTFAGYSLGGMTVQNLVNNQSSFLKQQGLTVTNMITYGSPVMGPPKPGVNYTMYDSTADPVPLLSYYENPLLGSGPNYDPNQNLAGAAGLIVGAEASSWDNKLHHYIDPKGEYQGDIIPITDQGTDPGKLMDNHMHYYQSNQLNDYSTTVDINPASLGPTEYFPMQNS